MKIISMLGLALALSACMQAPQADLEGLKGMGAQWQTAFDAKDAGALAALYTTDGAVLPPHAQAVSGRAAIEAFWQEMMDNGLGGTVQDVEVYANGDLGYKAGTYSLKEADGTTIDDGKYVEVWRRIDDHWQLHRDIFNSNRPLAGPSNRVVVTAEVDDAGKWEAGFRTHGELLKSMSQSASYFAATDENRIAVYSEPTDLDRFMQVLKSPETAEAMKSDGVDRDTVQVFVLDKEFSY